eukprot:COSAG05_NODE_390_length_10436_cov_15.721196_10_plen_69_part_00
MKHDLLHMLVLPTGAAAAAAAAAPTGRMRWRSAATSAATAAELANVDSAAAQSCLADRCHSGPSARYV